MVLWEKDIVDIDTKGNLVRFFLGNYGKIPDDLVISFDGWCDVAFNFNVEIVDNFVVCNYFDILYRDIPCLYVNDIEVYFGDNITKVLDKLHDFVMCFKFSNKKNGEDK